jgi:hypothetical protein
MEAELRTFLLANAALTALIGQRVTWVRRPQASGLPALTLQIVGGSPDYTMAGRVDLVGRLVQMDIWAATYESMKAVERALIVALDVLNTAPFQAAFIESQRETSEAQVGPDATGSTDYFRSSSDVRVWHQPI